MMKSDRKPFLVEQQSLFTQLLALLRVEKVLRLVCLTFSDIGYFKLWYIRLDHFRRSCQLFLVWGY